MLSLGSYCRIEGMDKKDKPLWGKKSWLGAFGFIVLASFWLFNIDENTPLKIKKKNNKLPTEEIGALPPGNSKTDEKSSFQAKVDEVERIKKMALKLRPCELEKMILGKKSHGAQAEHVFKALKGEKNVGTYEVFYQAIFTSDLIGQYEWEDFIYDLEYGARFLAATAHFKEFSGRAKGSLTSNKLFKKLVRHYKREEDIGYLLLVMKKEAESRNRLKVIRSLLKLVDNKKVFEGYQAKVFNDLAGLAETPQELILAYFLRSAAPRVISIFS